MLLTKELPECVDVGGVAYPINTDFRAGIEFETLIQKGGASFFDVLSLFFGAQIPPDYEAALQAVMLFYCCGDMPEQKGTPKTTNQAYSFEVDSAAIYADFWRYYGINLWEDNLHWWIFRALLSGLPEKSEFQQRVYYRTCDTKDLPKNEKKRVLKIREKIAIRDNERPKMTLEERNKSMIAYIQRRAKETAGGD